MIIPAIGRRVVPAISGLGAVVQYCKGHEPDAATQASIKASGNTFEIVDCSATGVPTTQPVTPSPFGPGMDVTSTSPYGFVSHYNPEQFAATVDAQKAAQLIGGSVVANNILGFQFSGPWNMIRIAGHMDDHNAGLVINEIEQQLRNGRSLNEAGSIVRQKLDQENAAAIAEAKRLGLQLESPDTGYKTRQASAVATGVTNTAAGQSAVGFQFTGGRNGVMEVGDSWRVDITGPAGQDVKVTGGKNGSSATTKMGVTQPDGRFSLTGTTTADLIGDWVEQWTVGDKVAGNVNFKIVAKGQGAAAAGSTGSTGGNNPIGDFFSGLFGGGGGTGAGAGGEVTVKTSGGLFGNPLVLGAIAVGAFLLLKKK